MNKVILIGNLTKPPELRYTAKNTPVCSFTLAVNRRGKDEADFVPVTAWSATAENCAKYLDKGRKVCVTGELQNRSYEAKDGTKRTVTEVVADDIEFLTPRAREAPPEGFTEMDDGDLPF